MKIYKCFVILIQDRVDESAVATEQKRRKDDERGKHSFFNYML